MPTIKQPFVATMATGQIGERMSRSMHAYMNIFIYIYNYEYVDTYIYIYTYLHKYIYMCVCTCICICIKPVTLRPIAHLQTSDARCDVPDALGNAPFCEANGNLFNGFRWEIILPSREFWWWYDDNVGKTIWFIPWITKNIQKQAVTTVPKWVILWY